MKKTSRKSMKPEDRLQKVVEKTNELPFLEITPSITKV